VFVREHAVLPAPQNSNRILTTTTVGPLTGWSWLAIRCFAILHMRRQIAEGGAALRRAHAKHAERIRGFCDEGMTLIEYVRNVVGL